MTTKQQRKTQRRKDRQNKAYEEFRQTRKPDGLTLTTSFFYLPPVIKQKIVEAHEKNKKKYGGERPLASHRMRRASRYFNDKGELV